MSDDGDVGRGVQDVVNEFPTVVYQKGPRRGLSANRNACIEIASSDWVLFVDDDVTLPGDFFAKADDLLFKVEAADRTIISGTQWDISGDEIVQMFPRNADFWGFQSKRPAPQHHRSFVINATVFPRALFAEARFDAHLRYGSDEIDMARHAIAVGYKIAFYPELQVEHRPAKANRLEYAKVVNASRLYAAGKAHWMYDRSWYKSFLYLLLAPSREVLAGARRGGIKGAWNAIRSLALAASYALKPSAKV